jgi:hypothetical protein
MRRFLGATCAALCFASLAAGVASAATPSAPDVNETCFACHGDKDAKGAAGKSIAVEATAFAHSVHGEMRLKCTDCHGDVSPQKLPHPEKLKAVNCATCHDKAAKEYGSTVHGMARKGGNSVAATCTDCHGRHDIRRAKDPVSRTNHANLEATCGKCHGNDAMVAKGKLPGGNIVTQFHDSIHGKALAGAAAGSAPTCTNCHGAHTIRAKGDADSTTNRARIPDTCGTCHKKERAQFAASQHGKLRHEGNLAAPGCNDCHSAHRIQQHTVAMFQTEVIKECGNCHSDHLSTYRDTFPRPGHGARLRAHGHLRLVSRLARDPARFQSGVDGFRAKPPPDLPEVSRGRHRELRELRPPREPARSRGQPSLLFRRAVHGVAADWRDQLLRHPHAALARAFIAHAVRARLR